MVLDKGLPVVGDTGHDCVIEIWKTEPDGSSSSVLNFTINPLDEQEIIIKDPDGVVKFQGESTFKDGGSGADGKIHVVLSDIFDQPGPWTKQGKITFTGPPVSGPFHTQEIIFQVSGPRV